MASDGKGLAQGAAAAFEEIAAIIDRSRERAFRAVNRELMDMYWEIGRHIIEKAVSENWGKSVVKDFAAYIQSRFAGIQGFSA
jgi:F0F1-type ATP synthase membrane subunit b/b'